MPVQEGMLMLRRLKRHDKRGFTLGELLIVVGIVAVLVGIAIPVFRNRAEKAREAYDVATMRQAASAAVDLFYAGVTDSASAAANGLLWQSGSDDRCNAYGVYEPSSGRILKMSSSQTKGMSYGKGTKIDGGTRYTLGTNFGSYAAAEDYTEAVVMVSIYPKGRNPHVDVYWKNYNRKYIGGDNGADNPLYSIRIMLN